MKIFARTFFLSLITLAILSLTFILRPPKEERSSKNKLTIFCWGAYLPEEVLARFEKESGISVSCSFFTTNEELLSKVRQSKGKGYDIYICSDYAIKTLIKEGFVKPYEPRLVPVKERISPYLLHQFQDRENRYSLPLSWEIYGLILPKDSITKETSFSLKEIFNKPLVKERVVMTPDPVEAVTFAAHYLFGQSDDLDSAKLTKIRGLLKNQKKWVESYTDYRTKQLVATENCRAGLMKTFFLSELARENPHISFVIPKEGIFTSIESFALSSTIQHEKEAYQFLNFLYRPEIMALQTEHYSLFPACPDALPYAKDLPPLFFEVLDEIERRQDFHFFKYTIPPSTICEMWVHAKT
jgi:spermidine/putrescine transport system substrate-binding protein